MSAIEADRERLLAGGRALRSDQEKRLRDRQEEVDGRKRERREWIDRRLRTVETPYVRLAAVFVPRT